MVRFAELADSTDVFVIGGGPAGLAVAIAARQQGLDFLAQGTIRSAGAAEKGRTLIRRQRQRLLQHFADLPPALGIHALAFGFNW